MPNVPPAIRVPRIDNVHYVPGDLYWNPTDLSDPNSGYGDWLGMTAAEPELRPGHSVVPITDETFMAEKSDELDRSYDPTLFALLAEHTAKNYELGFALHNTANKPAYKIQSRASTGKLRSELIGGKLLFLPYDRDNHNCILLYRAVPRLDSGARLSRKLQEALVLPVVFSAMQDPVRNIVREALLEDLLLEPLTISGITETGIGTDTATIEWTTDKLATSKVKYGTVMGGPYPFFRPNPHVNTTFVTSHSVGLTGLTTSTQYFYVVESYDQEGNRGISAEGDFTTT